MILTYFKNGKVIFAYINTFYYYNFLQHGRPLKLGWAHDKRDCKIDASDCP